MWLRNLLKEGNFAKGMELMPQSDEMYCKYFAFDSDDGLSRIRKETKKLHRGSMEE